MVDNLLGKTFEILEFQIPKEFEQIKDLVSKFHIKSFEFTLYMVGDVFQQTFVVVMVAVDE